MADWPDSLPCALMNSYTESPPENTIRSQMDTGIPKLRRRSTAATRPISFSMSLTAAQYQLLDDFYVNDVFSGSIPFNYTHPVTGAAVEARFLERPQYRSQSGRYLAAINLEILP